jgi:F0F1-type ATP synthase beta subunit
MILMEREPYWDYMGRRLREDNSNMSAIKNDMAGLTESHYNVLQRLKEVTTINQELQKKIAILGGDPKQLELDI